MIQGAFVSGAQDHAGSLAGLECFLPARRTEAPTVAGFQAAKAELRHRCRKLPLDLENARNAAVMTAQIV